MARVKKIKPNNSKHLKTHHNIPYATRRISEVEALRLAFRKFYIHSKFFTGKKLSFRECGKLMDIPWQTLWRFYYAKQLYLHPRNLARLRNFFMNKKYKSWYQKEQRDTDTALFIDRGSKQSRIKFFWNTLKGIVK